MESVTLFLKKEFYVVKPGRIYGSETKNQSNKSQFFSNLFTLDG